MASLFTKIINKELPAYRVYEDDDVIAILALDQVTPGHTLVIPKNEVNHWFDVPPATYAKLQTVSQRLGKALQKAFGTPRVLTAAVGFEVPHYHLHLIPANSMDDLNFRKGQRHSAEAMEGFLAKIKGELS